MSGPADDRAVPASMPGHVRLIWLCLGWGFFGPGLIGAFLPVLPTTPFMIIALWAFSKSSRRFQRWLYTHRIFGPPLQRWHEHRVIPPGAKMASLGAMSASLAYLILFTPTPWPLLAVTGAVMAAGAWYILTKPSRPPATGEADDDNGEAISSAGGTGSGMAAGVDAAGDDRLGRAR